MDVIKQYVESQPTKKHPRGRQKRTEDNLCLFVVLKGLCPPLSIPERSFQERNWVFRGIIDKRWNKYQNEKYPQQCCRYFSKMMIEAKPLRFVVSSSSIVHVHQSLLAHRTASSTVSNQSGVSMPSFFR